MFDDSTITFTPNDLLKVSTVKSLGKFLNSDQIDSLIEKLLTLSEELKEQEKLEQEIEAKKQKAIDEIKEMVRSKGLSLDDLLPNNSGNKPKRKPGGRSHFEPKYKWINGDGTEGYWSGQGVIPKAMRLIMERDNITDKEHYLINKE